MLEIKDLHASIEGKEILKGVSININEGEKIAIMGPNGSGKSTLASIIMGHPAYKITKGSIHYKGENITEIPPEERARKGIFLSFQYPQEIPGVTTTNLLRQAIKSKGAEIKITDYKKILKECAKMLKLDESFLSRNINEGFSGGEKKRSEIFQMAVLKPSMAILDETDSGLDIDALKIVADGVNTLKKSMPSMTFIIITHYQRLLNYVVPDKVFILENGKIKHSGGPELAQKLEEKGYSWIQEEFYDEKNEEIIEGC
ncbi:Fe-S cluster assembly ATPase SufC [Candidatus Woesearchaeota archaeon]|nr:Fe-S cluster assembly ATPase SufC [Candidatus Woesearchaeota archaeon]